MTDEIRRLRKENLHLKQENDALKAAIPDGDDRVYACLVACVGFTTDDLEEMNGTFMQILHRLGKQRDGLREKAEEILNALDDPNPTGIQLLNARDNLRAELEKDKP